MRLLEGDGLLSSDAFSVVDGTVTLDLRTVIRDVLVTLQQNGVIPSSVTIPPPGEASGALAAALGVTLPPDFGQVVVYQTQSASDDGLLDTAQRALALLKRAVVLLVLLALVLAVAAIVVAVDRRRAIARLGLAVLVGAIVVVIVARRVAAAVPDVASTPGSEAVAAAVADALRSSLVRVLLLLAGLGAVVAALARWWATLARATVAHPEIGRLVAIALGLLVLLVAGLGWGALLLAVVVVAVGLAAVEVVTRHPDVAEYHPEE
jgi:hypothetical protein